MSYPSGHGGDSLHYCYYALRSLVKQMAAIEERREAGEWVDCPVDFSALLTEASKARVQMFRHDQSKGDV